MWIFIVYLFLALQVAALIGGIVTRRWPLRPQQLVWRGTSVEVASTQIKALLYDIDDVRFAYPTGQFVPVDDETDLAAGNVVMSEANFKGSKGLGVLQLFRGAGAIAAEMAGDSVFVGLFVGMLLLTGAAMLAAPFLIASLIDVLYRALYRSRITASVREHPSVPNAVTLDLTFRGLSAFGIVGDVLRASAEPAAPVGSHAAQTLSDAAPSSSRSRAAKWAGAAERRSSIVYGTGVAASVVVALVLALVAQPGSNGGSSGGTFAGDATPVAQADVANSSASADSGAGEDSNTSSDSGDTSSGSADTSETANPNAYTSSGGNYSVVVPDGWLQNADEKYHPGKGAFTESKWHSPGDPDVYALVDYTPGFAGTALEGARPVRDTHRKERDYQELDFSADGDARRYEFISGGLHKLDVFHKCGTTGVAVLAAAPVDRWDEEQSTLTDFVDSFSCGATEDSSTATTQTATATSTDTSTQTPVADSGSDASPSTSAGAMELAIRHHWNARLNGDYEKAFSYYTGAVLKRVGTEAGWSEQLSKDALEKVSFSGFRSLGVDGDVGRVEAKIRTESRESGCRDWVFTYVMKHRDRWLIANTSADDTGC